MGEKLNEIASNPLLIICDTCVYASDFKLTNSAWKKIFSILKTHQNAKLVLPEAVELEVLKKIREFGLKKLHDLETKLNDARKYLISIEIDWQDVERDFEKRAANFSKSLASSVEKRLVRTPLPTTSAGEFFHRAVAVQRPFKGDTLAGGYRKAVDGFRDAVIWESVKEVYKENSDSTVIFYTTNSKDFSDGKSENLHPELAAEIQKIRKEGKYFQFVTDEAKLDTFLTQVQSGKKFRTAVEAEIEAFVEGHLDEIEPAIHSFGSDQDQGSFHGIDDFKLTAVQVNGFYEESDDYLLAEADAFFNVTVDFFIDKSAYAALEDDQELTVIDGDWNDNVMLVSAKQEWLIPILASIPLGKKQSYDTAKVKVHQLVIAGEQIDAK